MYISYCVDVALSLSFSFSPLSSPRITGSVELGWPTVNFSEEPRQHDRAPASQPSEPHVTHLGAALRPKLHCLPHDPAQPLQ